MFEIDWALFFTALAGIGVTITAVATVIRLYFIPWREKKRKERLKEKKKLEGKRHHLYQLEWSMEQNLKRVEQEDFSMLDLGTGGLPQQIVSKVENYIEDFHHCSDWFVACQNTIRLTLYEITKNQLPKTMKEYHLNVVLYQSENILHRFLHEEEVTKRWIEKTYPSLFGDIMEHLKESERKLDTFFIKVNEAFQKHTILRRFRKETEKLIDFGQEIIKDCKREVELLNEELSKYSDVAEEEK